MSLAMLACVTCDAAELSSHIGGASGRARINLAMISIKAASEDDGDDDDACSRSLARALFGDAQLP